MKTETEIKDQLKITEKALKAAEKQFVKYDNHDDLEEVDRLRARVGVLKWVLS